MKRILGFVSLMCLCAMLKAQSFSESRLVQDGGKDYKITVSINVGVENSALETLICKRVFGMEGTYKECFENYCNPYKKGKGNRLFYNVEASAKKVYQNEETGLVCISYVALPTEGWIMSKGRQYLCYDLKKEKQIYLDDLISPALKDHIEKQGIDASGIGNIYALGHYYEAVTEATKIKMNALKLYKNMSDYGLELVGYTREEVAMGMGDAEIEEKEDAPNQMAEFYGGEKEFMNYIFKNIKYPRECEDQGIQGRVIVKFTIDKDGTPCDVEVHRSPHELMSQEATRLITTMPTWRPARHGKKFVRTYHTFPLIFGIH